MDIMKLLAWRRTYRRFDQSRPIPVEALDKPIPCAGWSIKKETWYDRDITFRSDSLPDGAVTVSGSSDWILWTAAALVAVAVVAVFLTAGLKRKKKAGGKA